ncbi:MAG: GTPase Era [Alphaproteobacteria bacterium]|nr:GTPase Era [Alphaproteobacteria bacterium]
MTKTPPKPANKTKAQPRTATAKAKPAGKAKPAKAQSATPKPAATKLPPKPKAVPETRAGFVAIVGAPNAGKSTLLNRLVGQKISITSPKPQTTRMRITGVMTEGAVQIGFVDTPGIFAPKRRLDHAMVQAAWGALDSADAIILLVDASLRHDTKTDAIIAELQRQKRQVALVLNKVDTVQKSALLPLAARLHEAGIFDAVFMISAMDGDGVNDLKHYLGARMPKGPWFFGEDQLSDLPTQLLAAEITREQLFRQLQQELPYGATVVPEKWENRADGSATLHQSIVIERATHRPMVLGKGGARIKQIGEAARRDLERFLGHRVHLFLDVKCDEKWQDRPEFYRMFGLEFAKQ